ncbi:MAG: hypothetical protein FWE44_00055 [Defluviitaleaceae bacterium]|nr:hypothetical protein [Defluviitaleaceae bacterium]
MPPLIVYNTLKNYEAEVTKVPLPTPKSIFAIFSTAGGLYLKSLKFLAVATALAFIPVYIFRMFLPYHLREEFLSISNALSARLQDYAAGRMELSAVFDITITQGAHNFMLMYYGIGLAFLLLIVASATYLAKAHTSNENPSFSDMFNQIMPAFPKMLVTTALVAVAMYFLSAFFVGFFIIIPIYFGVGMMFINNITADKGRWGLNAISYSRFLVRGQWFRSFGILILFLAAYFLASFGIDVIIANFGLNTNIFIHLPVFLLRHLLLAFFALAFALWYFDVLDVHKQRLEEMERRINEILNMGNPFGRRDNNDKNDD